MEFETEVVILDIKEAQLMPVVLMVIFTFFFGYSKKKNFMIISNHEYYVTEIKKPKKHMNNPFELLENKKAQMSFDILLLLFTFCNMILRIRDNEGVSSLLKTNEMI